MERDGDSAPARVALVLGAGGVVGGAFHAGVLAALHDSLGWDPRQADIIVGTSAGSITGATLRAGVSANDLFARATGRPLSPEGARLLAESPSPVRPMPRPSVGRFRSSADMAATLARAAARPFTARPLAVLAGLVPEGTVGTEFITAAVSALHPGPWPEEPLWVCAVRQRDGKLVVFGRDTTAPVPDAVAASCAIPGFFRPVSIDGETYVDGGAHSPTNADLVADDPPTIVLVSSPMSAAGNMVRRGVSPVRRWARTLLDIEAARLRRKGVTVIGFQPNPDDLAVMGFDAMDPRRRADVAEQVRRSTRRRLEHHDTRARLVPLARF